MSHQDKNVKLEETANKAFERLSHYAEDEKNFYSNPKEMLDEMNIIKNDLQDAWKGLKDEHDRQQQRQEEQHSGEPEETEETFRSAYVATMTDAFDESLEQLRQQHSGDMDVNILVECMQSGINLLSPEERGYFLEELQEVEDSSLEEMQ
jgi:hypothetical protein